MKLFFLFFSVVLLFSCYQENNYNNSDKRLENKIDSLQSQIQKLSKEMKKNVLVPRKADSLKTSIPSPEKKEKKKIELKTKPTLPQKTVHFKEDTIIHRFINRKLSVKIYPEINNKKKIVLFNPMSEISYEFEDIQLSYSSYTELKFRDDGSVESSLTHLNPGASMYWYETKITFDNQNTPITKQETELPITRLDKIKMPSLWNTEKKQWIQQEVAIETLTPPSR